MFKYVKHSSIIMNLLNPNKTSLIVAHILNNPDKTVKITEIAKELRVSKGSVSLAANGLMKEGILKEWTVDTENPRTRALKILLNTEAVVKSGAIGELMKIGLGGGVYGSWARGTNTGDSDIDLWIKPKKSFRQSDAAQTSREIRRKLGLQVQLLVLSKERVEQLKSNNAVFFYSLLFGSIKLFGEDID